MLHNFQFAFAAFAATVNVSATAAAVSVKSVARLSCLSVWRQSFSNFIYITGVGVVVATVVSECLATMMVRFALSRVVSGAPVAHAMPPPPPAAGGSSPKVDWHTSARATAAAHQS